MEQTRLSPSALSLFLDCPRCFWLDKKKGIRRPRGIFPSLPGGMDTAIKAYFDVYRSRGDLPPELRGIVPGRLMPDAKMIEAWRSWKRTPLRHEEAALNAALSGALDDCLVDGGRYIPLDYKTRGYDLKEDSASFYRTQLDSYCLILESAGYPTRGVAYLVYYWPRQVREDGVVQFHVKAVEVKTDPAAARKTFRDAVLLLSSPMPGRRMECEYCDLVVRRGGS